MNLPLWIALAAIVVLQIASAALVVILIRRQWKLVKLIYQRTEAPVIPGERGKAESLAALQSLLENRPYVPALDATSPQFLLAVADFIRRTAPLRVVECGAGASTVLLAMIMRDHAKSGRLFSLEDHRGRAKAVQSELESRGLSAVATVIPVKVAEAKVPGASGQTFWYDLGDLPDEVGALPIDLLIVHGPNARPDIFKRYPAGPELFPRLSPNAHIFVENEDTLEEASLSRQWRKIYPDLGVREILPEISAVELFFLDHKIEAFMPQGGAARVS
ncbi:MAG: class I SAM-dependent methyltransferase [Hyphomicrobiales bacterium]|nr:class I SAM-dependent methyltransferase [Hyphomicrobiales bacterium]